MRSKPPQTPSRIDRLVRRARGTIAFERLWPVAVLAMGIVAVFVAVSWLGVWPALPRVLRIVGVVLFAAGLGATVVLAARDARISRVDALRRLDRDSGLLHRPLSTAEDHLANQAGDPLTLALWEMSRRRIEGVVRRVRVAPPAPRLAARDPFALRALAALVLVAAAFIAGPHKDGLLASAFDWRSAGATAEGFRVDAWIDPPGYTGKPPIVLFAREQAGRAGQEITVPAHSTVVVRASGPGALDVRTEGALKPAVDAAPSPAAAKAATPAQVERRLSLDGNGRLVVLHDGTPLGDVTLKAVPDLPPTIALVAAPKPTARGGLTLAYKIDDDYGVTGADASFSDPTLEGHPIVRSLVPPPKLALDLPPTPGALGTGQTTGDLSDHPWAGAEVTVVLSTKDEGGNVGLSAPVRMTLPARPFNNPLARALVEQRQDLVFDPDHRDAIATALDALMVDPDQFGTSKAVYLGLYTAGQRLAAAKSDDDLIALSDYLWQMALKIEDGSLDQTARDLRAAEQALRDALQKGASPDEIKKLTEDLRKQMDKFVAELQRKGQQKQARADRNSKVISQHDLEKMMQRMEEMAQSGQTAEAQRMLDELQNLLDNLQTAEGSPSDQDGEMNKQMSELDKMTRDQQGLRDKTFKKGQRSRSPDGSPSDPQDDQDDAAAGDDAARDPAPQAGDQSGNDDLQGQQQALSQRLQQLQKTMRQHGMKGEQGLDDAGEAMKDAEGALGEGPAGNRKAVEAQGRALAGLQKGASGLAEQMAQGQSDQSGEGQGHGGQVGQGSSGDSENDPLGRKRESRGTLETQGNAIDEGVAARAQRVLQELRRRLGDPNRPTEEMDYLERLLRRN